MELLVWMLTAFAWLLGSTAWIVTRKVRAEAVASRELNSALDRVLSVR